MQTLQYPKYSVFRFRNQKVGIYSKMLDLKVLMIETAEFVWWAMTTLAPKTLWMIWILSARAPNSVIWITLMR
jgi:hypothetical protein